MTSTPRVDALIAADGCCDAAPRLIELAKKLERELSIALRRIVELRTPCAGQSESGCQRDDCWMSDKCMALAHAAVSDDVVRHGPTYIAVGTLHAFPGSALHVTLDTSVQLPEELEPLLYVRKK